MAEQTIKGYFLFPELDFDDSGPNFTSQLIDAADEKAASIIQAPKTGTISKVGFRTITVATGATVDVRLETLSGSDPSGNLLGANSNGAQVIGDGDDNTFFTTALTTPVAVTKGEIFAVVIVNPAGSPGNIQIARFNSLGNRGFPYTDLFTGSWAVGSECPCISLEYDDGSYEAQPFVMPLSALNVANFSSGSTPDHRGLKFKFPFPFSLTGFWLLADIEGSPNAKLYDSDGTTVLETLVLDANKRRTISDDFHYYFFASTYSLAKDVFYRLVIEPTATAVDLHDFDVAAAAIMDAFPGGQDFHYTQKKDAGWTDITTKRPFLGLMVKGFSDGVGGGGGGASNLFGGLFGKA